MKGILLLNGQPYGGKIDASGAVVYCSDGAYSWAKDKIKIDKNIGDFDSLGYMPCPLPEEIYPAEKDYTDGEIAIHKLIESGATQIDIYGGYGGREDHFIGNLQLLYFAHSMGVFARLISENTITFACGGKVDIKDCKGKTISVLPFGGTAHIMGSEGLKYAFPAELKYGSCRGISNIAQSDSACIYVKEGDCVLVLINKGEV